VWHPRKLHHCSLKKGVKVLPAFPIMPVSMILNRFITEDETSKENDSSYVGENAEFERQL